MSRDTDLFSDEETEETVEEVQPEPEETPVEVPEEGVEDNQPVPKGVGGSFIMRGGKRVRR